MGSSLDDLGKGLRSQVGTMFSTSNKGVRYLEMAEGYVLSVGLDENNEIIGYKFCRLGKMLEDIRNGKSANEAFEKNVGTYGRYDDAVKYIDRAKSKKGGTTVANFEGKEEKDGEDQRLPREIRL